MMKDSPKEEHAKKPRLEAKTWCYTSTEDTEFSFAWTIEKFSRKMQQYEKGKCLVSDTFKVEVEGVETSWELSCYPNGDDVEYKVDTVGVYLRPVNKSAINRCVTFVVEVVNEDGSRVNRHASNPTCFEKSGRGWNSFVTHEKLKSSKLLPKDCFELFCVMNFAGLEVNTSGGTYQQPTTSLFLDKGAEQKAWSGVLDLWETDALSDIDVVCEEKTISCHKAILASKSPVFWAMFTNDMKEKATSKITIDYIDLETVKDMVFHIYGGEIDDMEEKADKLLAAAERYDLKELKKQCEQLLAIGLNSSNCLEYLVLADLHSAVQLKQQVTRFIVKNFSEMVEQEKTLVEKLTKFPEVLAEVFNELASLQPHQAKTLIGKGGEDLSL